MPSKRSTSDVVEAFDERPMSPITPDQELALLEQAAIHAGKAFGPCFDPDAPAMAEAPFDAAADLLRLPALPDAADAPAGEGAAPMKKPGREAPATSSSSIRSKRIRLSSTSRTRRGAGYARIGSPRPFSAR